MSPAERAFREQFGDQFKAELKSRSVTQAELADKIGVSRVMVNQWCNGTRVPTLFRWWQIQQALKEGA